MLPIYLVYDSKVNEFEARCIMEALTAFKKLRPRQIVRAFGSQPWSTGNYSSADWYVRFARRIYREELGRTQLDAGSILTLLENEPWQEQNPHIDLFSTSHDLNMRGMNFCFGMTRGRNIVLSVYRFRKLCDNDRALAIQTLIWHELGHIFGLASNLNREHTEELYGPHCTNVGCSMHQGISVKEWVSLAREVKKRDNIYCSQCITDLRHTRL